RRVVALTRVRNEKAPFRADGLDRLHDPLRRLVLPRRGHSAVFEFRHRTHLAELDHILQLEQKYLEIRVGYNRLVDTALQCLGNKDLDFLRRQVRGRKRSTILRHDVDHVDHLREQPVVIVNNRDSVTEYSTTLLGVIASGAAMLESMVGRVDRWHPDDLPAELQAGIDSGGVDFTDIGVQYNSTEDLDFWDLLLREVRPRYGALDVGLDDHRSHFGLGGELGQLDVIHQAREEVRIGM